VTLDTLQPLLDWMHGHPGWMGALVFLVAMTESLLVVGMIVPGAALMVAFGALIESGVMDFWATCAWAVLGAVAGDGISFAIGRIFKDSLPSLWPFRRHGRWIKEGERYFERHGGKSILFGRFVGPVRAIIPAVAGMLGMSPTRFVLYNVLSALAWAPIYLLPGIVFAASLELAGQVALRLAVVLGLTVMIIVATLWSVRRLYRWAVPHVGDWTRSLLRWSSRHPLLGKPTLVLVDPDHPETAALAVLGLGLIGGPALLLAAVNLLAGGGAPTAADALALTAMTELRTTGAVIASSALSTIGSPWTLGLLSCLVLFALIAQRARFTAAHWSAALVFAATAELAVGAVTSETMGAFGTYAAPVLFGFAAVLTASALPMHWRWAPYSVASLLVVLLISALLYLGQVWLSEAMLGMLVGGAWVAFLAAAYRTRPGSAEQVRMVGMLTLAAVLAGGAWALARPPIAPPAHTIAAERGQLPTLRRSGWLAGDWQRLPAARLELGDKTAEALDIQWAADPRQIRATLERAGWQDAPPFTWSDLLNTLSPQASIDTLPVLPRAHAGRHGQIRMQRPTADGAARLVVRFWPGARLDDVSVPVWIGQISLERAVRRGGLFTLIRSRHISPERPRIDELIRIPTRTVTLGARTALLIDQSPGAARPATHQPLAGGGES
jgi:undecaprenyl-diphosphatase